MCEITEEERICAVERSRRMYQTDMQSNYATVLDRGRKEGRAEGEQKRNIEIIRNLTRMGFSLEQISEATGLSPEEVKRFRAEN